MSALCPYIALMTQPYHLDTALMTPAIDRPIPPRRHRPYKPRPKRDPFLATLPGLGTRDGRRLRALRADLVAHCGGAPTAPQGLLIDRVVMLTWQSVQLDRAAAKATGPDAVQVAESAMAITNTIGRALCRLGLDAAPRPRETYVERQERLRLEGAQRITA
jgi:hypothetical protein